MKDVTWSLSDKSDVITLSNGNLTLTSTSNNKNRGHVARATLGRSEGKYYYELDVSSIGHRAAVGFVTKNVPLNTNIALKNREIRMFILGSGGKNDGSVGISSGEPYADAIVVGDVVGVGIDFNKGTLEFYRNGTPLGVAFNDINQLGELLPAVYSYTNINDYVSMTANFGGSPFKYEIPKGYYSYDGSQYGANNKFLISLDKKYYSVQQEVLWHETKMTSNTTPSPFVASARTEFNSSFLAWKAFNGTVVDSEDRWRSVNKTDAWIKLDFNEKKDVDVVKITAVNHSAVIDGHPISFVIDGSNDDVNWTTIKQFTSTPFTTGESREFEFDDIVSYRLYRLTPTASQGSVAYYNIGDISYGHYLKNKISLPSDSEENFVNYGMNKNTKINLDRKMDNVIYISNQSKALGSGKVFEIKLDSFETKLDSIVKDISIKIYNT